MTLTHIVAAGFAMSGAGILAAAWAIYQLRKRVMQMRVQALTDATRISGLAAAVDLLEQRTRHVNASDGK